MAADGSGGERQTDARDQSRARGECKPQDLSVHVAMSLATRERAGGDAESRISVRGKGSRSFRWQTFWSALIASLAFCSVTEASTVALVQSRGVTHQSPAQAERYPAICTKQHLSYSISFVSNSRRSIENTSATIAPAVNGDDDEQSEPDEKRRDTLDTDEDQQLEGEEESTAGKAAAMPDARDTLLQRVDGCLREHQQQCSRILRKVKDLSQAPKVWASELFSPLGMPQLNRQAHPRSESGVHAIAAAAAAGVNITVLYEGDTAWAVEIQSEVLLGSDRPLRWVDEHLHFLWRRRVRGTTLTPIVARHGEDAVVRVAYCAACVASKMRAEDGYVVPMGAADALESDDRLQAMRALYYLSWGHASGALRWSSRPEPHYSIRAGVRECALCGPWDKIAPQLESSEAVAQEVRKYFPRVFFESLPARSEENIGPVINDFLNSVAALLQPAPADDQVGELSTRKVLRQLFGEDTESPGVSEATYSRWGPRIQKYRNLVDGSRKEILRRSAPVRARLGNLARHALQALADLDPL